MCMLASLTHIILDHDLLASSVTHIITIMSMTTNQTMNWKWKKNWERKEEGVLQPPDQSSCNDGDSPLLDASFSVLIRCWDPWRRFQRIRRGHYCKKKSIFTSDSSLRETHFSRNQTSCPRTWTRPCSTCSPCGRQQSHPLRTCCRCHRWRRRWRCVSACSSPLARAIQVGWFWRRRRCRHMSTCSSPLAREIQVGGSWSHFHRLAMIKSCRKTWWFVPYKIRERIIFIGITDLPAYSDTHINIQPHENVNH